MNQTCKVCGEPAAGFHFGAFTCEGCKSFFGRSYNNLSSISECKNNGECIINKKNRTACKACRLRKCLLVGMSKSGSRYGRRSNWFKIHCLLQEQQQQQQQQQSGGSQNGQKMSTTNNLNMLSHLVAHPSGMYGKPPFGKEEFMMLGLDEYSKQRPSTSPSVSSPDSHNSDSSVEVGDRRHSLLQSQGKLPVDSRTPNKDFYLPLPFPGLSNLPMIPPSGFIPPSHFIFPGYHPGLYSHHQHLMKTQTETQPHLVTPNPLTNNNLRLTPNHHSKAAAEELTKRYYLDIVLNSQRSQNGVGVGALSPKSDESENGESVPITPPRSPRSPCHDDEDSTTAIQDTPIDLTTKTDSSSYNSGQRNDHRNRSVSRSDSEISHENNNENPNKILVDHHRVDENGHKLKFNHQKYNDRHLNDRNLDCEHEVKRIKITTPLDLTTKV